MTDTQIGPDPANRITCQLCYGQNGNHQVGCIMGTERQSLTNTYNHPMPPLDVAMNRAGQFRHFGAQADAEQKKLVVLADELERQRAEIRSLDQANGGALQEIERLGRRVEQQRIALDTAFDLLESAQPADRLESATPEDWYTERDAWKKRNDGSAPRSVSSSHEPFVHPCGYFSCVLPAGHDGVHQFPNRPALKSGEQA